jgi:hypothetical protein
MNTFIVNGNEYTAKAFDFNLMCDLEDMGVPLQKAAEKNFKFIRSYFAICAGLSEEEAGKEIESHVISGGDMDSISDAMNEEMEKSDFFRALMERKKGEAPENEEKKTEKK